MTCSLDRWLLWFGILTTLGCSSYPRAHRAPTMTILTEESQQGSALHRILVEKMQQKPSSDGALIDPIVRIAARVIAAARQSASETMAVPFSWELAVVEDDRVRRVFVLPEGGIVVYSGIFHIAETEAGLAAILCHEIAHALARHGSTDMVQQGMTEPQQSALFTRDQELVADEIGLKLMAEAGYDPWEMLRVWQRMKMRMDEPSGDLLLSHITYDRRMDQISAWVPEALLLYERARRAPQRALPQR